MKQFIVSYPLGEIRDPEGFGRSVDSVSFAKEVLGKLHSGADVAIPNVFQVQVVDRPDLDESTKAFPVKFNTYKEYVEWCQKGKPTERRID